MRQALLLGAVDGEAAHQALFAAADALTRAGYVVLATSAIGNALGRAGRIALPIELHTREPALVGGRFELAHLRVVAAVGGEFRDAREAEALRGRNVTPIEIVCGQLPVSGRALGTDASGAFVGAASFRRSPWLLHAAVIESACVHADDVLVVSDPGRLPELLSAMRQGGLGAAQRAALAAEAWRQVGAFRVMAAELLGLPSAVSEVRDEPDRPGGGRVAVPQRSVTRISGPFIDSVDAVVARPLPVAGATTRASGAFEVAPEALPSSRISGAHAVVEVGPNVQNTTPADDLAAVNGLAAADNLAAADADANAPAAAESHHGWPELRLDGRASVTLPTAAQPALVTAAATVEAIEPARRADLAAALAVLTLLGEPAVVIASGGLPCVAVRQVGSPVRALLRAFATDPLALQGGTLATTIALDLTAARSLIEPPGAALGRIAWVEAEDEAVAVLSADPGARTLQFDHRPGASHSLACDALGAWFMPRRTLPSAQMLASKLSVRLPAIGAPSAAAALRLGLALLRALPGRSAVAVHAEMAFAIVGGQAHVSDALQIAIAKVRKPPTGTFLIANAAPPDLRVVQPWLAFPAPVAFVDLAPGAEVPAGQPGAPLLMVTAAELDAWAAAEAKG